MHYECASSLILKVNQDKWHWIFSLNGRVSVIQGAIFNLSQRETEWPKSRPDLFWFGSRCYDTNLFHKTVRFCFHSNMQKPLLLKLWKLLCNGLASWSALLISFTAGFCCPYYAIPLIKLPLWEITFLLFSFHPQRIWRSNCLNLLCSDGCVTWPRTQDRLWGDAAAPCQWSWGENGIVKAARVDWVVYVLSFTSVSCPWQATKLKI